MNKLRDFLLSDKGRRIINILFLICLFFRHTVLTYIAFGVWIIYLLFCLRKAPTKVDRIIYLIFLGLVLLLLAVSLIRQVRA